MPTEFQSQLVLAQESGSLLVLTLTVCKKKNAPIEPLNNSKERKSFFTKKYICYLRISPSKP